MDSGLIRLILVVILVSIPVVAIQFLILKFAKKRIYKYIFPGITLLAGAGLILYARLGNFGGFADLAYIILGFISLGVFLISSIATLIFEKIK